MLRFIIPLLALFLVSCASTSRTNKLSNPIPPPPADGNPIIPSTGMSNLQENNRKNPWERLYTFEKQYRSNAWNYSDQRPVLGLKALLYPTTQSFGASKTYLSLGNDFNSVNDFGAASRAYWAALTLVNRAFASRPDKERIRKAAYLKLAEIEKRSNHNFSTQLFNLVAYLAGTYLNSSQANADDRKFYADFEKLNQVEKSIFQDYKKMEKLRQQSAQGQAAAEEASGDASVTMGLQAMRALLSIASIAAGGSAYSGIGDSLMTVGAAVEISQFEQMTQEQIEAFKNNIQIAEGMIKDVQKQLKEDAIAYREKIENDIRGMESGKTFVTSQILFYLSSAENTNPYLRVLKDFAQDKKLLLKKLNEFEQSGQKPNQQNFAGILDQFKRMEKYVNEREQISNDAKVSEKAYFEEPKDSSLFMTVDIKSK
jgi:hypothetical protein